MNYLELLQEILADLQEVDSVVYLVLISTLTMTIVELLSLFSVKRKKEQRKELEEKINRLLYVNQVNNDRFNDHLVNSRELSELLSTKNSARYNFYDDESRRILRHLYFSQQSLEEQIERLQVALTSSEFNHDSKNNETASELNATQLVEQIANMTNMEYLLSLLKDDNEKKYIIMRNVISDIAHTLRTPISGIHAILMILNQSYADNPELVNYFSEIDKCLSQVEDNLQAYQDLMLEGNTEDEQGRVAFNEELSARLKIAILSSEKKLYVDCSAIENITTDKTTSKLLLLALDCLIENATFFANDNSTIKISGHTEGEFYIFEIQNDGQLVAQENLRKIFLNGFSTRSSSGKGLFFVKNVVEARLGGAIDCENVEVPTKGVKFIIMLEKERLCHLKKEVNADGESNADRT